MPVGGGGVDLDHLAVSRSRHRRRAVVGAAEHDGLVADGGVLGVAAQAPLSLLAALVEEGAAVALDVPHRVDAPPIPSIVALVEGDRPLLVGSSSSLLRTRADDEASDDDHGQETRGRRGSRGPSRRGRGGVPRGAWPWLGGEDSNLQQPAPKAGVLPVELPPIGRRSGYVSTSRSLRRRPVRTMARR